MLQSGYKLAGRYVIGNVIAAGGMGVIYSASHTDAGWNILVKEFYSGNVDIDKRQLFRNMFKAEADIMLGLSNHAFIPHILDYVEDGDFQYIVMTKIPGQSLDSIVQGGPQPEKKVARWAYDIFSALEYLHGNGIVHRDLKPANCILDPEGRIKIVDFGIAERFLNGKTAPPFGTPNYAAPEQRRGIVLPASDIYSTGATLYEVLSGKEPRIDQTDPLKNNRMLLEDVEELYEEKIISTEMRRLIKASANEQPDLRPDLDSLRELTRWCGFYQVPNQLPDWLL